MCDASLFCRESLTMPTSTKTRIMLGVVIVLLITGLLTISVYFLQTSNETQAQLAWSNGYDAKSQAAARFGKNLSDYETPPSPHYPFSFPKIILDPQLRKQADEDRRIAEEEYAKQYVRLKAEYDTVYDAGRRFDAAASSYRKNAQNLSEILRTLKRVLVVEFSIFLLLLLVPWVYLLIARPALVRVVHSAHKAKKEMDSIRKEALDIEKETGEK